MTIRRSIFRIRPAPGIRKKSPGPRAHQAAAAEDHASLVLLHDLTVDVIRTKRMTIRTAAAMAKVGMAKVPSQSPCSEESASVCGACHEIPSSVSLRGCGRPAVCARFRRRWLAGSRKPAFESRWPGDARCPLNQRGCQSPAELHVFLSGRKPLGGQDYGTSAAIVPTPELVGVERGFEADGGNELADAGARGVRMAVHTMRPALVRWSR